MNRKFPTHRGLFVASALVLALSHCECEEELSELIPDIVVTPAQVDLSERVVARTFEQPGAVEIGNRGTAPLRISSIQIEPPQSAFEIVESPTEVEVNQSTKLTLRFTPPQQGEFNAELVIQSDDPDEKEVRIPLKGIGGPPRIEADPNEVDFGVVNEGPGLTRQVRLTNVGFDVLHISEIKLASTPGGTAYSLNPEAPTSLNLEPAQTHVVDVSMFPNADYLAADDDGILEDTLIVESDAENTPHLEIPLFGGANLAPIPVVVEMFTRQPVIKVAPRTNPPRLVTFDGSETTDPEGDPFTYGWSLAEIPADSDSYLLGATESATQVAVDAVGTFVVRLRATDNRGAWAEADGIVLPRDFAIVLEWETASSAPCQQHSEAYCEELMMTNPVQARTECCGQTDIDLHFLAPGGTLGDYGTCPDGCVVDESTDGGPAISTDHCYEEDDEHLATCRQMGTDCQRYFNGYPEWGVPGRIDDPSADIDDVRGFGPEVITMNQPADGAYSTVVHFCTDRIGEPSIATVKYYVKGVLEHTAGPQLIADEGQAWIAAYMTRSGGPGDEGLWNFVSSPGLFDDNVPADLCNQ
jgi:hypothetical protein